MRDKLFRSIQSILPKKRSEALGSLEVYPHDVDFSTRNPGEKVYILTRSHVIVNLGWVIRAVIFFVMPALLFSIVKLVEGLLSYLSSATPANFYIQVEELIFSIPLTIWIMVGLTYYGFLITYMILNFIDWYFDIYLVTNERILHMDFVAFTGKRVAETPLTNVVDISQKTLGFLPTVFNYGDVRIQTAAEKSKFLLRAVPDPNWFRDVLADLTKLIKASEP